MVPVISMKDETSPGNGFIGLSARTLKVEINMDILYTRFFSDPVSVFVKSSEIGITVKGALLRRGDVVYFLIILPQAYRVCHQYAEGHRK